jgi:hypothetical protein
MNFFTLLFSCSNTESVPSTTEGEPLQMNVSECTASDIHLSNEAKEALRNAGFTKCIMPFGVLIAADTDMPDDYVKMAGLITAELLDPDKDGTVNDTALLTELQKWEKSWLAMPMDNQKWEEEQLPQLSSVLGYDIVIPMWWMEEGSQAAFPTVHGKAVMVEEIIHFMTQFGWSTIYPEQFSVDDWNSLISKETQRAACDWWQHPENSCPDNPAEYPGDCSDPNCDVVEFYHQVLILRAGMQPGWFGIGFPRTKEDLESKLSIEIKAMMDDPQYHQIKTPLTYTYPD